MPTYTVHVPSGLDDDLARAERTIFVREGFSLPAFVFGPLFLVYRRLWRAALVWCVVALSLAGLSHLLSLSAPVTMLLFLVLAILVGLEAHEARRQALGRRGYIGSALITGATRSTVETIFFSGFSVAGSGIAGGPGRALRPSQSPAGPGSKQVIGLFPHPAGGFPAKRR